MTRERVYTDEEKIERRKISKKQWNQNNPKKIIDYRKKHSKTEQHKLSMAKYRASHREELKTARKIYYEANKEELLKKSKLNWPKVKADPIKLKKAYDQVKASKWLLRLETIKAFGGRCECCGEDGYKRPELMTIEHVGGWGKEHREQIGRWDIYRWLKKNGFPREVVRVDGSIGKLELLCFNCNLSKANFGYCPHEKEQQSTLLQFKEFQEQDNLKREQRMLKTS